jgi:hypothetical protein
MKSLLVRATLVLHTAARQMSAAAVIAATLAFGASPGMASVPNRVASAPVNGIDAREVSSRASDLASRRVVMPSGMRARVVAALGRVPSFSRQTGLPCSACHYQFPQLTPFGRLFKLNGYSLVGLKPIVEPNAKKGAPLSLLPIPPLSVMLVTSETHLTARRPGAQNDATEFPQQLSVFLAGALTPHIGTLIQATYSGGSGTFGIDNSDIRYVTRARVAARDAVFGVTLHNNPAVQDLWNTTPAWGYPFIASDVTPGSIAGTVIDGSLAQQVVGLGGYAMWNSVLYLEATGYRTALQPGASPPDSTAANAIHGVTPYWRAALQHQFGSTYGMLGTYGLLSHLYPAGIAGPTNRFADVAFDAQLEHPFGEGGVVVARTTWINEQQSLAASLASGGATQLDHTLNTVRLNVTLEPSARYAATLGYFSTTGTRDTILYAPAALGGSGNGRPTTDGISEELDFNPWQNTRLGIQGVQFSRFNGAAANYDAFGRRASGNNAVYVFAWVAF